MSKYSTQPRTYNLEDDETIDSSSVPASPINPNTNINRDDFDEGFVFGIGTSAYQHEGAAAKGGRGKTIWDDFALRTPDRIDGGSNGNVASDMYARYKEDIKMMKDMGFDAYRFSISWSRILPGGRPCMGVNKEGIDFYNDIINTLLANGIEPYVTLFHFDLPHCLETEYGGFAYREKELKYNKIVNDFVKFAELCFWEFGDRVKTWTTINEPWSYAVHGYVDGFFPPSKSGKVTKSTSANENGKKDFISHRDAPHLYYEQLPLETLKLRDDNNATRNIDNRDSNSKPIVYTVAKNLLLCHAAAVDSYRTNFMENQGGKIGITLITHWFEPYTDNKEDVDASKRAIDFMLGWFLEPVLSGEYPKTMKKYAESFSAKEKSLLKGSIDFLGLNYYTANYAAEDLNPQCADGYYKDMKVAFFTKRYGKDIGEVAGSSWLYIVPWGFGKLLKHISTTYKNMPDIYITENGVDEKNNWKLTANEACGDWQRINYHADHLAEIIKAMKEDRTKNLRVKGYFAWSWCDNFEWTEGYTVRFGVIYVDYMNGHVRYPKQSAKWFANQLLKSKRLLKGQVKQIPKYN